MAFACLSLSCLQLLYLYSSCSFSSFSVFSVQRSVKQYLVDGVPSAGSVHMKKSQCIFSLYPWQNMYELLAVNLLECSVGIPEPLSEELCEVRTCSFFISFVVMIH